MMRRRFPDSRNNTEEERPKKELSIFIFQRLQSQPSAARILRACLGRCTLSQLQRRSAVIPINDLVFEPANSSTFFWVIVTWL